MAEMEQEPFFSTIIIVDGVTPHLLARTLESVLMQKNRSREIIVIEKGSNPPCSYVEDHRNEITRIYSSINENIFAMINKGIEISRGRYLHFLTPGEYYTTPLALTFIEEECRKNPPDLLCTGYMIRHLMARPTAKFFQINEESLEKSRHHWSLQSYYFKRALFDHIGHFNPAFPVQGSFDFLCRVSKDPSLKISYVRRILTDYEIRKFTPIIALEEAIERLKIILKYFGLGKAFFWWIAQNHIQFFKWWFKAVREAVWRTR